MAAEIKVRIKAAWDSALTYDHLDRSTGAGQATTPEAVFVGRRDLLDPLIAAIRQPAQRGTYLISGYRGTGKTTLVIEALRRAQAQLVDGWQLFPLVLNVSEVSASLESAAPAAGTAAPRDSSLRIEPRRLLIALLRALERHGDSFRAELRTLVHQTYSKAAAKDYSRSVKSKNETSNAIVREASFDFKVADVYKLLTGLSGVAALGVGAVAIAGAPALTALAVALGATSAAGLVMSQKVTKKASQESQAEESLTFDNSLHQLENDLRDILAGLYAGKLRTVVILEELDKMGEDAADQLDGVIRYFKNLFTQAPALFFFLTDKSYFDLISSKIKKARRQRSYAVEHTFFTHRVFVGRPSTRDCLDYLKEVVSEDERRALLTKIYTSAEPKAKSLQDMDGFSRFVRVLLFRAANHLFDLKNELRHFVRAGATTNPGEVELVIDDQSLPEDQAAVAVLQDRVEEKAGSFALASGRAYANEVLHDCLYAVFNELGSTRLQKIADFYPFPAGEQSQEKEKARTSGARSLELLLEEQLEANEVQRIQDAVKSLVEDLQRGGALDAEKTDFAKGEFTWKQNAARVFRYVRKLEKHEEEFVAVLTRLGAGAAAFKPGAALGWLVPNAAQAATLVGQLDNRVKEAQAADTPLPVEKALEEREALRAEVAKITAAAYVRQTQRFGELYGMNAPLPVAGSPYGGGLFQVESKWGDPRSMTAPRQGVVLLAQGEGERLDDDVREFVARCHNLERLSLIHVIHAPGDPAALETSRLAWVTKGQGLQVPAVSMDVLPLDEGLAAGGIETRWGERLGRELLFRTYWASQPRPFGATPEKPDAPTNVDVQVTLRRPGDTGAPSMPLSIAVSSWLETPTRVLWVAYSGRRQDFLRTLSQPLFTNVAGIKAVKAASRSEFYENLGEALFLGSGALGFPGPFQVKRGAAVEELVTSGRLILLWRERGDTPSPTNASPEVLHEAIAAAGRAVMICPTLPKGFAEMGVTQIEPA